ncbi:crustacean calcium-binding protein 23-like [Gigantopelta aegis]|uniref:crustacean calcium-binding protein 23-like n=1 Tax=Gigantopelta aegis TaxID=1735272 RepID=UPI001B887FBA|nr:crustacean calcium-binding protein 23-like [Gigantopelta aegis]
MRFVLSIVLLAAVVCGEGETPTALEKMKTCMQNRGTVTLKKLGKLFTQMDSDRSWYLTCEEFTAGVGRRCADVTTGELQSLCELFDTESEMSPANTITYDEFVHHLQ